MKTKKRMLVSLRLKVLMGIALVLALGNLLLLQSSQTPAQTVRAPGQNQPNKVLGTEQTSEGALTLGDGKISNQPKARYIYSCQQTFNTPGGAGSSGSWVQGEVWYPSMKPAVSGSVSWKNAKITIGSKSTSRTIEANGLPNNHKTGVFPIASTDPAYAYDRNPNAIKTQTYNLALPRNPEIASAASCVPMGMIGIATNGVAIFNGLDAGGRDAVAHELQDKCSGHPQQEGAYHYHGPSTCMPNATKKVGLVGYALDGFGIYSMYDSKGKEIKNSDLDECHGMTSKISWNGKTVSMYHYVLTKEYPYTIGCFKGTPIAAPNSHTNTAGQQMHTGSGQPPQEAVAACSTKTPQSTCSFTSPHGDKITGSCQNVASTLACVPTNPPPQTH